MRNILDNLQLHNRAPNHAQKQVDTGLPHQHIPVQGPTAEDLIGDFDRPNEVYDNLLDNVNANANKWRGQNVDPILNQQWEDPPHMQPPMMPTNTPVSQQHVQPQTQR